MNPLPSPDRPGLGASLKAGLNGIVRIALRLALGLAALFLMVGALLVAAVLALGLLIWSLLRGRRPPSGLFRAQFERTRRQPPRAGSGPVIDIEAREIPDPPSGPGTQR